MLDTPDYQRRRDPAGGGDPAGNGAGQRTTDADRWAGNGAGQRTTGADRWAGNGAGQRAGATRRTYRVHRARRRPRPVVVVALLAGLVVAASVALLSAAAPTTNDPRVAHAPLGPPPPAVPHPAVSISQAALARAADNAALELAGSGDGSPIAWFPNWGLWGNHNAPPGARVNWGSPYWWQSALDLRALIRYLEVTHNTNPAYQQIIEQTFVQNVNRPGTPVPANFANKFMDDTGWWGLAWLEAARYELDVRGDIVLAAQYLKVAEWDAGYLWNGPHYCRQPGIEWQIGSPPDTITNAEFAALAGELAYFLKQPGPLQDTAAARRWQILWWLRATRLINVRTGHVWDRFDSSCHDVGGALVYTEGEVADALVQMGLATGRRAYFSQAQRFIQYTFSPAAGMLHDGVLQQPCEAQAQRCLNSTWMADSTVYKGLFVDAVADWQTVTHSHIYDDFLRRQGQAVAETAASNGSQLTSCQTPHDCQIGFYWARAVPPADGPAVTPGTQMSGLAALTDALSASG